MGGKNAEHLLESLGGSRDQTVARTYLGKEMTVKHEDGYGDTAEHLLESLGGSRDQTVTPTAPPGLNSTQPASENWFSADICRKIHCQAQIKY